MAGIRYTRTEAWSVLNQYTQSPGLLKHALADLLPREVLSRPKRGFGVPLDRWFRQDLASYAAAMLGPSAHVRRHVNGIELDRMLAEHSARASNHGHALWTLLTLELFLRRHGW